MTEKEQIEKSTLDERKTLEESARQAFESAEPNNDNDAVVIFKIDNTSLELEEKSMSFSSGLKREGEKINPNKPISTPLYMAAKMEMQRRVNKSGKPKKYIFLTVNPRLALWADTTGRDIFQWTNRDPFNQEYLDNIQKSIDDKNDMLEQIITFSTVIRPE